MIRCNTDGDGGATITDEDGRAYYAGADDLKLIGQLIACGHSTQNALRLFIVGLLAEEGDEE